MDNVARYSDQERRELFIETANKRGLNAQIIEKDFWVCWTLKQLFKIAKISDYLIFKGGTSLSKVYKVIERFSEDIDVAIDREYLGFGDQQDLQSLTVKKREKIITALDKDCTELVKGKIFNELTERFSEVLGEASVDFWTLTIDENDPYQQTILLNFPRKTMDSDLGQIDYIRPIVKIELGARPENQPIETHSIKPYSAEDFPELFENPSCEIQVLSAERTFWEKATILHDEYHRLADYKTADRISRHYYDFFELSKTEIADKAIQNLDLLESVIVNKKSYFYRAGAKYDEVSIGKLHLTPSRDRLDSLKKDYEKMKPMFFVTPPSFQEIVKQLTKLEQRINLTIA